MLSDLAAAEREKQDRNAEVSIQLHEKDIRIQELESLLNPNLNQRLAASSPNNSSAQQQQQPQQYELVEEKLQSPEMSLRQVSFWLKCATRVR